MWGLKKGLVTYAQIANSKSHSMLPFNDASEGPHLLDSGRKSYHRLPWHLLQPSL